MPTPSRRPSAKSSSSSRAAEQTPVATEAVELPRAHPPGPPLFTGSTPPTQSAPSSPPPSSLGGLGPLPGGYDEQSVPGPDAAAPGSAPSAGSAFSRAALRDSIKVGIASGAGAAHELLARDELAQEAGLYLADEDDQTNLADPLAGIASRRMRGAGAMANPDLGDAIAAAIALAVYAIKQLHKLRAIRAARRGAAPAGAGLDLVEPEPES